jgi:hypothetical protein
MSLEALCVLCLAVSVLGFTVAYAQARGEWPWRTLRQWWKTRP